MHEKKEEISDVLSALGAGPIRRFFHRDGPAMYRSEMVSRLESLQGNSVAEEVVNRIQRYQFPIKLNKYSILMENNGTYRATRVYGFYTE